MESAALLILDLQLVVHKFHQLTEFKALLTRACSLVRKFNTSAKATKKLITKRGKKTCERLLHSLELNLAVDWSSTYC